MSNVNSSHCFLMSQNTIPIDGIVIRNLTPHRDERGELVELLRTSWDLSAQPVQWNLITSDANVLRGMHVHLRHTDYLVLVDGAMLLGLCDLRAHSRTFQTRASVRFSGERLRAIEIPPGVAHGFYFFEQSLLLHATSHFYDPSDELGCRWDDPPLAISWPGADTVVSQRDRELGSFDDLLAHFR